MILRMDGNRLSITCFAVCMVINALVFFKSIPVFFIPDAILLGYLVYKFKDLDQEVSPLFFVGAILFFGYLLFSPEPADIEYQNKFIVTLKPFIYICVLSLYSRNVPFRPLYQVIKGVVVFYPFLLVWNVGMYFIKHRPPVSRLVQESRPYFIFENNFEITFYLTCFIALAFIYKEKSLKNYLYLCMVILLANSRSGLLSFLAVSPFYFWSLDIKRRCIAFGVASVAAAFVAVSRSITQIAGNIDRLQTLNLMWHSYDDSFWQLLAHPFGHGIYAKLPTYLCIKLPDFAEWFVGNSNNCDPIMLQAFYTRGLFQFGFYVTLFIPVMFFWLVKKETNPKLAFLIIAPTACVATSVGGFSNGLAFLGILLCVFAYVQVNDQSIGSTN